MFPHVRAPARRCAAPAEPDVRHQDPARKAGTLTGLREGGGGGGRRVGSDVICAVIVVVIVVVNVTEIRVTSNGRRYLYL